MGLPRLLVMMTLVDETYGTREANGSENQSMVKRKLHNCYVGNTSPLSDCSEDGGPGFVQRDASSNELQILLP